MKASFIRPNGESWIGLWCYGKCINLWRVNSRKTILLSNPKKRIIKCWSKRKTHHQFNWILQFFCSSTDYLPIIICAKGTKKKNKAILRQGKIEKKKLSLVEQTNDIISISKQSCDNQKFHGKFGYPVPNLVCIHVSCSFFFFLSCYEFTTFLTHFHPFSFPTEMMV